MQEVVVEFDFKDKWIEFLEGFDFDDFGKYKMQFLCLFVWGNVIENVFGQGVCCVFHEVGWIVVVSGFQYYFFFLEFYVIFVVNCQ